MENMNSDRISLYITMIFEREISILRSEKLTWKIAKETQGIESRRIKYENAETLFNVHSNLTSTSDRDRFADDVAVGLSAYEHYWYSNDKLEYFESGTSALAFYTLFCLGYKEHALRNAFFRFEKDNCRLLIQIILAMLEDDRCSFALEDLERLTRYTNQLDRERGESTELGDDLHQKITDIGFEIIKREIKTVNIEINRDKESVIQKIRTLGMGDEFENFLDELDQYINTSSGLVASGMISNFRSFWEKVIIEMARKVCVVTKTEIPTESQSPIGNARLHLRRMLGLSEADNGLINRFVDILHSEGGHAFISNVEYFRLTRNIGIEILLLLLTKVALLRTE